MESTVAPTGMGRPRRRRGVVVPDKISPLLHQAREVVFQVFHEPGTGAAMARPAARGTYQLPGLAPIGP